MLRKKLKEIQKDNSNSPNKDLSNVNKIQTIKSLNPSVNYRKIEKITKNNLPELRLSRLKSRIESERRSVVRPNVPDCLFSGAIVRFMLRSLTMSRV